jgi:hypothetical protein
MSIWFEGVGFIRELSKRVFGTICSTAVGEGETSSEEEAEMLVSTVVDGRDRSEGKVEVPAESNAMRGEGSPVTVS